MQKIFLLVIICFSFLFSNSNLNLTQKEINYLKNKKTINMCIDPNWMPFEKFDINHHHTGMTSDYFKIFADKLDTTIKVIYTNNWGQSLQFAKTKKCDILSLVAKTPQRTKYLNFTKYYIKTPLVLVTIKDVSFINDMFAIQNKKIGITKGYAFVEIIKHRYKNFDIVEVDNMIDGLNKVRQKELFAYIDTLATIGHTFQTKFNSELKITGKFDQTLEFGIGVRKDDILLLDILNKAVNSLDTKEHQTILNSWIPIKYESNIDHTLILQIAFIILIVLFFFAYKQYITNKSLKELNEILDATMELIILHKDGICIDVNSSTVKMLGYKYKKEIIGKKILDLVDEDFQQLVKENISSADTKYIEIILLKKDNTKIYALAYGQNIYNNTMRLSCAIDITMIKRQEKLLFEQAKMVQMGEMIGNIAHQWRQPLNAISISSSSLQLEKDMGLLDDEKFKKYTQNIIKNSEFLSKTVDTFKNYLKTNKSTKNFILQELINDTISIIEDSFSHKNIDIINNINDIEDIKIDLVDGELPQVIINILNNAKDILVEKQIENSYIKIDLRKINDIVCIDIQDNGGGIDKHIINKIFDPYFTTKHQTQGTGLGLYMSRDIINNLLDGKLKVKNTKDGALFSICFNTKNRK
jgi:PAS domain S-box-containing protein